MQSNTKPPRLSLEQSGFWHVRYYDTALKRSRKESLHTKDAGEAQQRFSQWLAATGRKDEADLTIGELIDLYTREHIEAGKVVDARNLSRRLDRVKEFFGHLATEQLTDSQVDAYVASRPLASGTVRGELVMLNAALRHNWKRRRIKRVPHITLPPPSPPRDRWLTTQEIDLLIATAERLRPYDRLSRVERFIWIGLEAPARKTAIQQLKWDRVDLKQGIIDFRIPGEKVTKKRKGPIPISDRLRPIIERAWEERRSQFVLDYPGSIRSAFNTVVREAGLKDVTPHVLRHSAATHMARAGVPLWTIAGVLGNTYSMVEKVYAHHCPQHLREGVNYQR